MKSCLVLTASCDPSSTTGEPDCVPDRPACASPAVTEQLFLTAGTAVSPFLRDIERGCCERADVLLELRKLSQPLVSFTQGVPASIVFFSPSGVKFCLPYIQKLSSDSANHIKVPVVLNW
ncbi:UNVERIFIED_CONTAM: hypothetical protein H355_005810 [Colinus virginianus]|nr:hypothetical protein H355_005810 [Colinus virginianus]